MIEKKFEMLMALVSSFLVLAIIVGGVVSSDNKKKLEISALGFYADEGMIESVDCSSQFQTELNNIGSETEEVYRVNNSVLSDDCVEELKDYLGMEVSSVENETDRKSYIGEDEVITKLTTAKEILYNKSNETDGKIENSIIDDYTINNAVTIYKDKIEDIIRLLGLEGYTANDFNAYASEYVIYTDVSGREFRKPCRLTIECELKLETGLECDGVVPFVKFDINESGEIINIFYFDKAIEKMDIDYELKDINEIISDIENDNNVLTQNVSAEGSDVVLEDVELKMYSDGAGNAQKYMIPYYYITGNDGGKEVEIVMPAIKNEYLIIS